MGRKEAGMIFIPFIIGFMHELSVILLTRGSSVRPR